MLAGLALAAAVLEVALGFVFWMTEPPGTVILRGQVADAPYVYYRLKPDPGEGINEDGFYTTLDRARRPGKFRIALIGGSVAKNLGKSVEPSGALILESALNRTLGTTRIELLDAGTSGYISQQELISLQMVVQHYEPDMVVALDGFNDLMTLVLNGDSAVLSDLPPHHWRAFHVIEDNRYRRTFWSRFAPLFRSTRHALEIASDFIDGSDPEDLSHLTPAIRAAFVERYLSVIADTRDFAAAKGMDYFGFLQPIRFYDAGNEKDYVRGDGAEELTRVYHALDQAYERTEYLASLSRTLDEHQECYRDNCHMNVDGHRILSEAMAAILAERIRRHPRFVMLESK